MKKLNLNPSVLNQAGRKKARPEKSERVEFWMEMFSGVMLIAVIVGVFFIIDVLGEVLHGAL